MDVICAVGGGDERFARLPRAYGPTLCIAPRGVGGASPSLSIMVGMWTRIPIAALFLASFALVKLAMLLVMIAVGIV